MLPHRWLYVFVGCIALFPGVAARAQNQFFDSRGVKIRYIVKGKGEPVVLIHGITTTVEGNWGSVITPLTAKYQVIALDCRGHGKSGKPHDPQMYGKEMGEDVIRLLDHLKIKRAHVVGYSMGAYITYGLIFTHPDRLLTATLGAGGGIETQFDRRKMKGFADAFEQRNAAPLLLTLTPPGQPKPTAEQVKRTNQAIFLSNDPKALAALLRSPAFYPLAALSDKQLNDRLKRCRVPLLGIVGSLDPLKANLDRLQARMTRIEGTKSPFTLVILKGATHLDAFTRPAFLNALQTFLAAHRQTP